MEHNNFNRASFESTAAESGSDESDSKEKKSKSKRKGNPEVGSVEQPKTEEKKQKVAEKLSTAPETIWQRLLGEKEAEKAAEPTPEAATEKVEDAVEADEQAAPLENLSEEEKRLAASAYVAERQTQIAEAYERAIEGGDEALAVELAADAVLLEAMQTELNNEEADEPAEAAIETAYDAAAQQVGSEAEPATEAEENEPDDPQAQSTVPPVRPPTQRYSTPVPQPGPGGTGGGGSTVTSARSVAGAPVPSNSLFARSTAARPTKANQAPTIIERHGGSALLVGGIIGYLIGRRRGRIKTEKRLDVVHKKLEKNVAELQTQIFQKEEKIKQLVRERQPSPITRAVEREAQARAERPATPRTEHLGLVSIKAIERTPAVPQVVRQPEHMVPAAEMQREELLAASNAVRVGETNLRRVYETRLISEQSLRRLVEIYQKGGDVRRELDRELLEKERSFERDPRMRNTAAGPGGDGGGAAVNQTLIAAVGARSAATYHEQAAHEAERLASESSSRSRRQVDLVVGGGVVLLVVIVILIIMVLTR